MRIPGTAGTWTPPSGAITGPHSVVPARMGYPPLVGMGAPPAIIEQVPSPWLLGGGAALAMMAAYGMTTMMYAAPLWAGMAGYGMMGGGMFGSGMWSPFPTFDNWNGGFNLPGPF